MKNWITFFATVISPLLLAWLVFANNQIKDRVEQHNQELDRRYKQQQDEIKRRDERLDKEQDRNFELAKAQTALTKDTLPGLSDKNDSDKRRLAVLTMLAYVDRDLVPPFMLSVLAIQESHENDSNNHIIDDMRTALRDLAETANKDDVKIHAARALNLLPAEKANEEAVVQVATKADAAATKDEGPAQSQRTARTQLAALAPALTRIAVSGQDSSLQRQAISALAEVDPTIIKHAVSDVTADLLPEQKKSLPPRVYLQIANEDQRGKMKAIQTALIASGYISPGIQNVDGKAPDTLEVRYFDPDSKSKAQEILSVIKANGAKNGRVDPEVPTANDLRISSDIKSHFEVWAGKNSF